MAPHDIELTADLLLRAYRLGLFPMAERRDSATLHFLDPERRGVLPLSGFHLPRRLARTLRATSCEIVADRDFPALIAACAAPAPGRMETWINAGIERLFIELHERGHAHSIEVWREGILVGGLYGLAIGGAFFGESMVSRERDASKLALVHLVARLRLGGFSLLDTQFLTVHLTRFGAMEVSRAAYHARLAAAVAQPARWLADPPAPRLAAEIACLAAAGANEADDG
ncbi:MAG: leucyl/phenylalanyl-tRNA--protein transferase [Acidiphilium sp. 37-67-22]|nr:MAG: leucyl/phenylalanyl-tRNA--protein transferase [Acidiphilium sp. 37-67-22]HQT74632.1 leucyl/phenylalanyl-tRNA--protein transferase [Acidiphilium sp.]